MFLIFDDELDNFLEFNINNDSIILQYYLYQYYHNPNINESYCHNLTKKRKRNSL